MQRATDDTYLDEIGGELGFDHASHALQAGSSFVALGDGEQAETEATNALQLFSEVPQTDRWIAGELAARVDFATARVMHGELAGAEEALGPVLTVHPELRTEAVTLRLTNLGHRLGTARYRNAEEATRIGEAIEDFTTRGLPRSSIRAIFNPGG